MQATLWNVTLEALPHNGSTSEFTVRPVGEPLATSIRCALDIKTRGADAHIPGGQVIPKWLTDVAARESCDVQTVLRMFAAELAKQTPPATTLDGASDTMDAARDRILDLHLKLDVAAKVGWVPGEILGIVKCAQRMIDEARADPAIAPAALRLVEYAISRYRDLPPAP